MENLINMDKLGDVIINFTNKLSDGIGWLANRETSEKIAISTYIQDIQAKDYDPLTKAALISNAKKVIKEYCNQNDIVTIAMHSLQCTAQSEKVDDEWIAQFMDKARLVSSDEFKLIWAKILARECNEPGSIPRTLLHTLERMDKEDAEAFTALCRVSVRLDETYSPVIISERFDDYQRLVGINFDKLLGLNALGLIEMQLGALSAGYAISTDELPTKVVYYDNEYEFSEDKKQIKVGNVLFTKAGQALCKSIEVEKVNGFWEEYCIPFWNSES